MKKIITKFSITVGLLTPFTIFAQTIGYATAPTNNLVDLANLILFYFQYGVFLIMGLAVVMFVWNIYKYFILGKDNAEGKKEAGLYVMWSIIGFFVILSFWGLVNIVSGTLRLNTNAPTTFFGSYNSSYGTGTGVFNGSGGSGGTFGQTVSTGSVQSPGFLTRVWNGFTGAVSGAYNAIF